MGRRPVRRKHAVAGSVRAALAVGADNARWLLDQRAKRGRSARRTRSFAAAARGAAGLLVAEGDSWFQYPFYNTLEALEDEHGYDVESVAHTKVIASSRWRTAASSRS